MWEGHRLRLAYRHITPFTALYWSTYEDITRMYSKRNSSLRKGDAIPYPTEHHDFTSLPVVSSLKQFGLF